MIKKVKEIKNIDAFDSFEWDGPELKKYNLIYGWNGAGKTTISRLFYSLENKTMAPELGAVNFQIQTDGSAIKDTDIISHSAKIKVFNEDFVRDNVQFSESKAKKILIVGKENADTVTEIVALETQGKVKQTEYDQLIVQRDKIPAIDSILTDAGREVVKQFTNTPLGSGTYYGRSYDRRKVEPFITDNTITTETLDSLIISKQEDIDRKREIIKSQKLKISFTPAEINDFSVLFADANSLLGAVLDVELIEELREDKELRDWTETGYHIHKNRDLNTCQFCKKQLDAGFLDRLGKFFTQELEEVKKKIDSVIGAIDIAEYKGEIGSIESVSLFPDLSAEYLSTKSSAEDQARIIRATIEKLIKSLRDKRDNLHEKAREYSAVVYPTDAIKAVNDAAKKIANIVSKHNEQIDKVAEAAKDIELHAIAGILKSKDYFQKKIDRDTLDALVKTVKNTLDIIVRDIKIKRASVLNAALAVEKINLSLKEFFGESHIYLESNPTGDEVGYILKRRGKNARNLSQGEKSVIALVYFLTTLEEDGFNLQDSLIVVDDPVDSQDELFLFKTFGLIKRHLGHSKQLIILTHNFPFFNLIRDWFAYKTCSPDAEFYLMYCNKNAQSTESKVEPLPELLKKYKTEYQYLFYQLYRFNAGQQGIDEPLVPNIGRKVLEYFAGFKWSCNVSEDFSNIVHNRYASDPDENIKSTANFIVKFLHEYSHGQDFSRPITASTFEAKSVASNILKFIEITDPEHYGKLKTLCES